MTLNTDLPSVISDPDKGGREYSPSVRKAILQALEIGCTRRAAYGTAGISESTFYRWLEEPEFLQQVEQAEAKAESRYTVRLSAMAARGDSTAVKFWLERRRPEDWRERKTIEATGVGGSPLFAGMSDDDLAAEAERLRSIAADGKAKETVNDGGNVERGEEPASSGGGEQSPRSGDATGESDDAQSVGSGSGQPEDDPRGSRGDQGKPRRSRSGRRSRNDETLEP